MMDRRRTATRRFAQLAIATGLVLSASAGTIRADPDATLKDQLRIVVRQEREWRKQRADRARERRRRRSDEVLQRRRSRPQAGRPRGDRRNFRDWREPDPPELLRDPPD